MKKLATLLIVFISITAHGQVWIDSGATWHYTWSGLFHGFDKIEYVGDTLIQDKTCEILQVSTYWFHPNETGGETVNLSTTYQFTYLNGDTVFYLVNDEFHVLYNMGAQVGDTWNLGVDTNVTECGSSIVEVTATGSTEINGEFYDWIAVTTLPNSSVGLEGKIYKRFGATSEYLFPTPRNCDPNIIVEFYMYQFSCFQDDSFPLYNVTDIDCDYLLSVGLGEIEYKENLVSVYPNPASNSLSVKVLKSGFTVENISIADMQGRLLKNSDQHHIDISDLPNGIYLIAIDLDNDARIMERFIKN